jgi:glycosyltransferase involved in cell wall biosynthesis
VSASRRLRVLALVPYPLDLTPSQRFRIEQWSPHLSRLGIDVTFVPFGSDRLHHILHRGGQVASKALHMSLALAARFRDAWQAAAYDAVWVAREASLVGPALAERLAVYRRPAMIFDFDDAVWVRYVSPTNRFFSYLKCPGKTRTLCRKAAAVSAGNEHLAEYARPLNANVWVVPTTVSLEAYQPRSGSGSGVPVIGWTGSHSSAQYLSLVSGALTRLRQRREFRLLIVGAEGISVPGVDTTCKPWRSETEVADIEPFDIGIMPLPDEPWARGKCALKAIQYMGLAVPPVVSPVGVNATVVEHGRTGFHATTEDEWVEALDALLGDAEKRRRMGTAAREVVARHYSAEAQAPRVAEMIRGITSPGITSPGSELRT